MDFYITFIRPIFLWGRRGIIALVTTVWIVRSRSWLVLILI